MITARRAWRVGDHFEVVSRSATKRYRVNVAGGMPLCTCTAAHYGRPCFHAAVVYRRLERELRLPCPRCKQWHCTCRSDAIVTAFADAWLAQQVAS